MVEFISNHWIDILGILVAIVVLAILYKRGRKETIKAIVLSLVVQAEKALGSGTGELKYSMVIDTLYSKLPFYVRFLFTRKDIDNYIEECVDRLKILLSDGTTLNSYDIEQIDKEY